MILNFIFDWNSFWINIIAGLVMFVLGFLANQFKHNRLKRKNRKYIVSKLDVILKELCDFLIESPFKDNLLNFQQISIFTKKSDIKNYRFVAICPINIFNKIVFPQMTLVIYSFIKSKEPDDLYDSLKKEHTRLQTFRSELERVITVHSLHMDDEIILRTSNLCFDIKDFESKFKDNLIYDELLVATGDERNGVMGINELPKIYDNLLYLIQDLIKLDYFECKIEKSK